MPKRARSAAVTGLPTASCRAAIEAAITRLIDLLDRIDGDPDLEPSLGSANPDPIGFCDDDQLIWAQGDPGAAVDAELDAADLEPEPDEDAFAPIGTIDQAQWGLGGAGDGETDERLQASLRRAVPRRPCAAASIANPFDWPVCL